MSPKELSDIPRKIGVLQHAKETGNILRPVVISASAGKRSINESGTMGQKANWH